MDGQSGVRVERTVVDFRCVSLFAELWLVLQKAAMGPMPALMTRMQQLEPTIEGMFCQVLAALSARATPTHSDLGAEDIFRTAPVLGGIGAPDGGGGISSMRRQLEAAQNAACLRILHTWRHDSMARTFTSRACFVEAQQFRPDMAQAGGEQ